MGKKQYKNKWSDLSENQRKVLRVLSVADRYLNKSEILEKMDASFPKPEVATISGILSNLFHDGALLRRRHQCTGGKMVSCYFMAKHAREFYTSIRLL